jgi:hypothetical protein
MSVEDFFNENLNFVLKMWVVFRHVSKYTSISQKFRNYAWI